MRDDTSAGGRKRAVASAAAALLLVGGLAGIGLGLAHGTPAAGQTGATATAMPAGRPTDTPAATAPAAPHPSEQAPPPGQPGPVLPLSPPVRLQAPSIGVDTALIQLGRQPDGEVAVPPVDPGSPAGWYTGSVAPGAAGSAVILGHVNAVGSPIGVFYRLHELSPGAQVAVVRADHTAAVFAVDRVDVYHKSGFPTVDVYRNADRAELRLITCSGFDPATGEFLDNTVVYAHLLSSRPA